MGLIATIRRVLQPMPEKQYQPYQAAWQWQPIGTAPSDKYLLLGWKTEPDNAEGFSHLIATSELHEGKWIDGPGPQPDFWMEELPYYGRQPMTEAPSGENIIVGWDTQEGDQHYYDFDVTELEGGLWIEGPIQPDWWMYGPGLPSD